MSSEQPIQTADEDGVTVIALGPEYENLDDSQLDDVRKQILAALDAVGEPPRVVLDLSHTRFFGSAFIEILFRAWNRVKHTEDGRFAICGLTPYCREVLTVTNLDRLWDLYPTREEAVAALRPA